MPPEATPNDSPEPLLSREALRIGFESVVRAHAPRLRRFLQRYTLDPHSADDLAQETFIRAYNHLDRFNDRRPFSPWLFTIAANLGRDFVRRRTRRAGREDALDDNAPETACASPSPAASLDRLERHARLEAAIAQLPDTLREPVLLHYELDWPLAAIATHLGVEEGAIKVRLHRARQRLHQILTTPPSAATSAHQPSPPSP